MYRRMFIETDVLQQSELRRAQRMLSLYLENNGIAHIPEIFDEIVDFAWHNGEAAWEAVKRCDEIYSDSSLIPIGGYNTYTGSVVVMDTMMNKAVNEGITGKSLYFLREYSDIEWDRLDMDLFDECFKKNSIFVKEYDAEFKASFIQVDINKIVKQYK